jgi:hypothetical protein
MRVAELQGCEVILILRRKDVRPEHRTLHLTELRVEHMRGSPRDIEQSDITVALDDNGESHDLKRRNAINPGPAAILGRPESFFKLGVAEQLWYNVTPITI